MGAKTAILAFAEGDLRDALRNPVPGEPGAAEALVRRLSPGYDVVPAPGGDLWDYCYPPEDVCYAAVLEGATILCSRRLAGFAPEELPLVVREAAAGRRILLHNMHSGSGALTFAVWEDGELVRSFGFSPDQGVVENIGDPYPFERESAGMDSGEAALRGLFGFVIEGRPLPDDVDAMGVRLEGFLVTDPTGEQQRQRAAALAHFMAHARVERFGLAPDGTFRKISDQN